MCWTLWSSCSHSHSLWEFVLSNYFFLILYFLFIYLIFFIGRIVIFVLFILHWYITIISYWKKKTPWIFFFNGKKIWILRTESVFFNLKVMEVTIQPTLFGGGEGASFICHIWKLFDLNESFEWIIEVWLETLNSISIGKCVYTMYCSTKA